MDLHPNVATLSDREDFEVIIKEMSEESDGRNSKFLHLLFVLPISSKIFASHINMFFSVIRKGSDYIA